MSKNLGVIFVLLRQRTLRPWLMGRVSALIHDVLPAKVIVDNMVEEAAQMLQLGGSLVKTSARSKL